MKNENGKLYGCSTDAFGFTEALKANGIPLSGKVLILGSGGAARTLARETCDNGCRLNIAVRNADLEKATELKGFLEENGGSVTVSTLDNIEGTYDLCVNATPVGIYPNTGPMA